MNRFLILTLISLIDITKSSADSDKLDFELNGVIYKVELSCNSNRKWRAVETEPEKVREELEVSIYPTGVNISAKFSCMKNIKLEAGFRFFKNLEVDDYVNIKCNKPIKVTPPLQKIDSARVLGKDDWMTFTGNNYCFRSRKGRDRPNRRGGKCYNKFKQIQNKVNDVYATLKPLQAKINEEVLGRCSTRASLKKSKDVRGMNYPGPSAPSGNYEAPGSSNGIDNQ